MKNNLFNLICICIALNLSVFGLQLQAQNTENDMDSLSYSLGVILASNLQSQGFDNLNASELSSGIADAFDGKDVDVEKANQVVQQFMAKKAEKAQSKSIEAEQKFLSENKKRDGITETASGLQYEVMEAGDGPKPSSSDQVTVHYTGTLLNGQVFDSSVKRGEPATFPVNGVIQGWQEALQLMPVGSKYKLYIPYDLAYGERGAGQQIPPYSTLVFEVELLEIK